MGIEPTRPAWKAGVLPLNYTRVTRMGCTDAISYKIISQAFGDVKNFFPFSGYSLLPFWLFFCIMVSNDLQRKDRLWI